MACNDGVCADTESVVLISDNVVDGRPLNSVFLEDDNEDVDLSCSFASIGTSVYTECSTQSYLKPVQDRGCSLRALSIANNSVDYEDDDFDSLEYTSETECDVADEEKQGSSSSNRATEKQSKQPHQNEPSELPQRKKPYFDRTPRVYKGVSAAQLEQDKQRIAADNQNKLNNFILNEQSSLAIDRHDHLIMLRQLIGTAYFSDPKRAENRPKWKKILAEVRKEYWGAHAIFNLSPDPYQSVVAKLSSMMLWSKELRNWTYTYHEAALLERQNRQVVLIKNLNEQNKLFVR